MKIRILKKNNKSLFSKRGKGFYGRVMVLGADDHHIVLQNVRGFPKTTAALTYSDIDLFTELNEHERLIDAVQRHYLKKYRHELLVLKSSVSLQGFTEAGRGFELELLPVARQTKLDFEEYTTTIGAAEADSKEGLPWDDPDRPSGKSGNKQAELLRDRERQPEAEQVNAAGDKLQPELEFG